MIKLILLFSLTIFALPSLHRADDAANEELTGVSFANPINLKSLIKAKEQKALNAARILASKFTLSQVVNYFNYIFHSFVVCGGKHGLRGGVHSVQCGRSDGAESHTGRSELLPHPVV